jgi:hypothetical protein
MMPAHRTGSYDLTDIKSVHTAYVSNRAVLIESSDSDDIVSPNATVLSSTAGRKVRVFFQSLLIHSVL